MAQALLKTPLTSRVTSGGLWKNAKNTFKPALVSSRSSSSNNSDHFKNDRLFDVSHVKAIVTGGGSGIGLMITQALSENGAKVYVTGRRPDALSRVVDLYNTGSGEIVALRGDISKKDEVLRLASEIEEKEPDGIQLLVNNAGIARDDNTSFSKNSMPDMTDAKAISQHCLRAEPEQWADTFATNVTAGYFMSMAFLPLLAKGQASLSGSGYTSSVVNISSISGAMKGSSGGQFSYAASKAAFTHLTRILATTFAETKVRVNCIAPGIFPSEMTAGSSDENQKSHLDPRSYNPAGRKGQDQDMAATILFLAGKGGAFYNHQILYPDGGNTITKPASN
ncbi:MAG: hypothetical protein M1831_004485 [Alyxoria varia]|nr:MAG: hypothetical protein M1831_004485 [Alyxoria varia]